MTIRDVLITPVLSTGVAADTVARALAPRLGSPLSFVVTARLIKHD